MIQYWLPDAPLWMMSLVLMSLMTATNLFSVSSFGEFEYWFAGIKVAAIVVFLVLGALFVLGLWPGQGMDFGNLTAHGGFFPHGVGRDLLRHRGRRSSRWSAPRSPPSPRPSRTIPARAIARATNSVIARIAVFFVGSIFLLAVILPWNSQSSAASPYVAAFQLMGIPGADQIMNAVVLTAVLSA